MPQGTAIDRRADHPILTTARRFKALKHGWGSSVCYWEPETDGRNLEPIETVGERHKTADAEEDD